MADFRETLNFCNLFDLGFQGCPWTFNNKQEGRKNVRVRLDRAVACPRWSQLFPQATVQHLVSSRSDHCPILLSLKDDKCRPASTLPRYEAMWEREASLVDCVEEAWSYLKPASNLEEVQDKLAHDMKSMKIWSSANFGSVNKEIKELKKKLGNLQNHNYSRNTKEIKRISSRLDELLHREEIMWKQRSRINWLKEGDQNTRFFHRKATGRAKKNKIRKLARKDGTFTDNEGEFLGLAKDFFIDLYAADLKVEPKDLLDLIEPSVPNYVNEALLADLTDDEIGDALFQIGPLKAPGPDGLPARFFQRNWGLLKKEVCGAIKHFF
jgi:hypothetical protein